MNERRHDTSAPFSKDEVAFIRKEVLTRGAAVECPRCGSPLSFERPVTGEAPGAPVWWVHCAACQRNLIVRGPTERSASEQGTLE